MLWGIGYAVPFSFLGPALAFIVFSSVILIIVGIRDIVGAQRILW